MAIEMYELTLSGSLAGQFTQTILNLNVNNVSGDDAFSQANDILEEFNGGASVFELFCDCLPENYKMLSARCRRILPTGGPTQIYLEANITHNEGTRSLGLATTSLCPLIIWLTTTRPTKTGRTFMPGLAEDDVSSNVLSAGLLSALDAFGQYFRDGGTITGSGDNWQGCVYRRALAASDDITNFRVSPIVGTQRRRLRPAG